MMGNGLPPTSVSADVGGGCRNWETINFNNHSTTSSHDCQEVFSSENWGEPVPFDEPSELPAPPVNALPEPIAEFVKALSQSVQIPIEMGVILALGVMAACVQRRLTVRINADYSEPLCLYVAAVGDSGERKSAAISALTAPIYEYERATNAANAAEITRSAQEKSLLEGQVEEAKRRAGKAVNELDCEQAKREMNELSEELAALKPVNPLRLILDDVTPEKLSSTMFEQQGAISIVSAEGRGLVTAIRGRYKNDGNLSLYLKGYSGDNVTVDRQHGKCYSLPNPRLSIVTTVQPDVIADLMSDTEFRQSGLCARFLFAQGASLIGSRASDVSCVPDAIRCGYVSVITHLLSDASTGELTLDAGAVSARNAYFDEVEHTLAEGGEWEHLRDFGSKHCGKMLRIAGLLHAVERPATEPIGGETVRRAVALARWLAAHIDAITSTVGADPELEAARYVWRRIERTGRQTLTKREILRSCKFKADELDAPLKLLENYNYIKLGQINTGAKGRPNINIQVNPMFQS
jgi:hypothetical protein